MTEKTYGYHNEVDRLMQCTRGIAVGDVITYDAIKEATGLDRDDIAFGRVVAQMKERIFAEREVIVGRAIHNVGYKLLTPDEQFDWGKSQDRRSSQLLKRGAAAIAVLAPDRLSADRRAEQSTLVTGMTKLLTLIDNQRVERRALVSKSATLPQLA